MIKMKNCILLNFLVLFFSFYRFVLSEDFCDMKYYNNLVDGTFSLDNTVNLIRRQGNTQMIWNIKTMTPTLAKSPFLNIISGFVTTTVPDCPVFVNDPGDQTRIGCEHSMKKVKNFVFLFYSSGLTYSVYKMEKGQLKTASETPWNLKSQGYMKDWNIENLRHPFSGIVFSKELMSILAVSGSVLYKAKIPLFYDNLEWQIVAERLDFITTKGAFLIDDIGYFIIKANIYKIVSNNGMIILHRVMHSWDFFCKDMITLLSPGDQVIITETSVKSTTLLKTTETYKNQITHIITTPETKVETKTSKEVAQKVDKEHSPNIILIISMIVGAVIIVGIMLIFYIVYKKKNQRFVRGKKLFKKDDGITRNKEGEWGDLDTELYLSMQLSEIPSVSKESLLKHIPEKD